MNFFAELKRRHMYRVAAAYAVVAWVLLQIVNNLAPGLNLPSWAVTLVIVLLATGFPIAMLFCWIQHMPTADGTPAQTKTAKVDWLLIGALIAVLGAVSYQQMASVPGANPAPPTASAGTQAGISIAVLPFANLSGDAAQEFFSDGTSEEITAALAKVPGLRVVGRSSAFQFKGQNRDLRAIGQALNARYLIDGSVRQAGNRVRITAQLIQANDGIGLWTENYDREMTDIFTIQENIAQAIAGALRVPLGLQQGELLVSNRSIDPDSYQQFLRAKAILRARSPTVSLPQAAAMLEEVVARHDDYAPAWALLALTYDLMPQNNPVWFTGSANELRGIVAASQPKAEAAAQRAVRLAPTLADGYVPLGSVQQRIGKLLLAEDTFSKALALDRNNADVLLTYSNFLAGVGRVKEALPLKEQARALEPFAPVFTVTTAATLWLSGQNDAAELMAKELSAPARAGVLAQIYVSQGRFSEAADALSQAPAGAYPADAYQAAIRIVRDGPTASSSAQPLPLMGFLGFVHLRTATPERSLEEFERNAEVGYFQALNSAILWHPVYAAMRKTERFRTYVRKVGLIEYWRAKGWPEFCHPTTGDDFACD